MGRSGSLTGREGVWLGIVPPVFSRNGPAKHIPLPHIQASEMMRDLNHILLVHHHPVGFLQQLLHLWMQVLKLIRVMIPVDILLS